MDESQDINVAWIMVSAVSLILLLGTLTALLVILFQRRGTRQEATRQEQETAYQKELLSITFRTQEQERVRIARDLHDEVGAMLSTVKMHLGMLAYMPQVNEKQQDWANNVKDLVDESIRNVRTISHDLLPPVLQDYGLHSALTTLANQLNQSGQIKVSLSDNWNKRSDPQFELGLYRVIQELLNNTMKHARAHEVKIGIEKQGDSLRLEYRDDGEGFVLAQKSDSKSGLQKGNTGLGLQNIQSRISMLNGNVEFFSAPGQGIRVVIEVPITRIIPGEIRESEKMSKKPETKA